MVTNVIYEEPDLEEVDAAIEEKMASTVNVHIAYDATATRK